MNQINKRVRYLYSAWYQEDVYMETDDWIYIAQLFIACLLAFGLGLFVGFLL
jgi:hypothetical protein